MIAKCCSMKHLAFAMEEGHGRGNLQGGHGHSVQVCSTGYGTAAGLEPALLHCILCTPAGCKHLSDDDVSGELVVS